jgi:EAL domain-containing protein (putative c-di-GMP-specific phosphodiesterase class I)
METACRQLLAWEKNPTSSHLILAINVSAYQFEQHDFVDTLEQMIRHYRIDPSKLKLELTESVIVSDIDQVIKKMHALKAIGVRISLDDFGTGYSSLSYLKRLPLDQLKIDQSFVRDIVSDPGDAVMVKTIIEMAKNFGLNVIAEGVETQAQYDFLKEHGCVAYQGFLFGRPMPIELFMEALPHVAAEFESQFMECEGA